MQLKTLLNKQPVLPAPMAGVTDFPFRQVLRKMGVKFVFTEMVSSKGLVYGNQETKNLLDINHKERNWTGVQLFGGEKKFMAQAASLVVEEYKPDLIDINMGCPVPKIVNNGAGAALMKEERIAGYIIEEIVSRVEIPVTVKMRIGWDENSINGLRLSKIAWEAGAEAVTIHGRTRDQFYEGQANWEIIEKIAREIELPVIGNGDIFSAETAQKKYEQTSCAGLMIARGLRGNPWLLKRSNDLINEENSRSKPDFKEKIKMAISHLEKAVEYYGEQRGIPKMRSHLTWYLKGLPYCSKVKDEINQLKKMSEVKQVLRQFEKNLSEYYQSKKE